MNDGESGRIRVGGEDVVAVDIPDSEDDLAGVGKRILWVLSMLVCHPALNNIDGDTGVEYAELDMFCCIAISSFEGRGTCDTSLATFLAILEAATAGGEEKWREGAGFAIYWLNGFETGIPFGLILSIIGTYACSTALSEG